MVPIFISSERLFFFMTNPAYLRIFEIKEKSHVIIIIMASVIAAGGILRANFEETSLVSWLKAFFNSFSRRSFEILPN